MCVKVSVLSSVWLLGVYSLSFSNIFHCLTKFFILMESYFGVHVCSSKCVCFLFVGYLIYCIGLLGPLCLGTLHMGATGRSGS